MVQNKKSKVQKNNSVYASAIAEMEAAFLDFQKNIERIARAQKHIIKTALERQEKKRIENILGQIRKKNYGR